MTQRLRGMRGQDGFTLIELLIVIVILGILAAIVVFAVGGITNRGQTDACKTDTRTLRTAEEANFAKNSTYADMATLVSNGFLASASTYHTIALTGGGTGYTLANVAPCTDVV
ncbi:MAG: type IV pilin protein [Actinomycetota bacterium]